jgi:hypothetical protein
VENDGSGFRENAVRVTGKNGELLPVTKIFFDGDGSETRNVPSIT